MMYICMNIYIYIRRPPLWGATRLRGVLFKEHLVSFLPLLIVLCHLIDFGA